MPAFPATLVETPGCQQNWEFLTSRAFDTGDLKPTARATAPGGWLLCDGASYLRTAYPDLFAALGGTASPWGLPDGTHFNVPDLRGRVPVGAGTGAGLTARALAASGGEEAHALTVQELQSQTMTSSVGAGTVGYDQFVSAAGTSIRLAGTGGSHNNMQPFAVVNWLIKA